MSLKNMIASDIDLFLNVDEFADVATFNGASINILFDKEPADTFLLDTVLCKSSDVASITTSSIFIINGTTYTASSWLAENGMTKVILNVQY